MTTGEAGYRSQALGLAEAIGGTVSEKIIAIRWPWGLLPGHLCPSPLAKLDPARDHLTPPWPGVLITCGRRSVGPSIAIRRASAGATFTVHVQHPHVPPSSFDLVVPMAHDGLTGGGNILPVPTALHRVTPTALASAAARWEGTLARIPHPRLAVLLGGPDRRGGFDEARSVVLLDQLEGMYASAGIGLMITPSRRTPKSLVENIKHRFADKPWAFVWDEAGDNPYFGMLALADALVVTADSVSMISEAIATGKPVGVAVLGELQGAPKRFLATLSSEGLALPFTGSMPRHANGASARRDAIRTAADKVREMLAARSA
jgi:mitochondrial fission protein ELM1